RARQAQTVRPITRRSRATNNGSPLSLEDSFLATDFADFADFVWLRDQLPPTLPIREIRAIRS
ncbi:MAG: hypothetical protein WCR06_10820, partial [bacterium]